ncbi:MAG: M1 family metallopeptidase [Anaerolineae bacterium]|nr:M1 family metallopeptidase [Anaerolineae bacterium]
MKKCLAALSLCLTLLSGALALSSPFVAHSAQPTLQPTETAVPLTTPTLVPEPPRLDLPEVDWQDVSAHKKAMKPAFADDVERFVDANRYFIVAHLTFEPDAVFRAAQRVRFTNRTGEALDLIVFRLYANTPALGGRMTVHRVEVNGVKVAPSLSDLRSVLGVPLPVPLQAGESVELRLDFTLVMTRGLNTSYGRFGYVNDVVSATAWYPTLSVYEPKVGWWTDLPSPQGDPAYTETGLYEVHLTLPADMVVAASGVILEQRRNADSTITYRNVTGPMRDHAFQASRRYMITETEADGTRILMLHYKDRADLPTDGTKVAMQYSVQALKIFNATFGEYPYAQLVVAQNPTPSGVEFPGIIQIAESAWVQGNRFLEVVIAHEIGHQWFYALVGNNQVTLPWIDESLTSYTEFVYFRAAYDDPKVAERYIDSFQQRYTAYLARSLPDLPLELPVRNYTGISYGAIIYTKGPLFFLELERVIGRETVYAAIAEYFRRHKYGIAVTDDVQRAFEDISGRNLSALFNQWVRGSEPRTEQLLN